MKAVLFCKKQQDPDMNKFVCCFQGFVYFDENEWQSLYQASMSNECGAILPPKE